MPQLLHGKDVTLADLVEEDGLRDISLQDSTVRGPVHVYAEGPVTVTHCYCIAGGTATPVVSTVRDASKVPSEAIPAHRLAVQGCLVEDVQFWAVAPHVPWYKRIIWRAGRRLGLERPSVTELMFYGNRVHLRESDDDITLVGQFKP